MGRQLQTRGESTTITIASRGGIRRTCNPSGLQVLRIPNYSGSLSNKYSERPSQLTTRRTHLGSRQPTSESLRQVDRYTLFPCVSCALEPHRYLSRIRRFTQPRRGRLFRLPPATQLDPQQALVHIYLCIGSSSHPRVSRSVIHARARRQKQINSTRVLADRSYSIIWIWRNEPTTHTRRTANESKKRTKRQKEDDAIRARRGHEQGARNRNSGIIESVARGVNESVSRREQ